MQRIINRNDLLNIHIILKIETFMDEIFQFVLALLVIFAFGLGIILLVHFTTKKIRDIKKMV